MLELNVQRSINPNTGNCILSACVKEPATNEVRRLKFEIEPKHMHIMQQPDSSGNPDSRQSLRIELEEQGRFDGATFVIQLNEEDIPMCGFAQ